MSRFSPSIALGLGIVSCAPATLPEYEQARAAALAEPPALESDWRPDAAILLSRPALNHLTQALLDQHGGFNTPLSLDGVGRAVPDLEITKASVSPSRTCQACIAVDATLDGRLRTEGLIRLEAPLNISLGIDVEVESITVGPDHKLQLKVRDVRKVEVSRSGLPTAVVSALRGPLQDQARRSLLNRGRSTTIAAFPAKDLPLRGIRVGTEGQAVKIELRTQALATADLTLGQVTPRSGWLFAITQESLGALARAESMRAGPVSHDIVPEPTAVRINGGLFEMDLRLWKTTGRGWWRDYTIKGRLLIEGDSISIEPGEVTEKAASDGAAMSDPLAYLGSSIILSTLKESLEIAMPAMNRAELGDRTMQVSVSSVRGRDGVVYVQGLMQPAPERSETRGGERRPR